MPEITKRPWSNLALTFLVVFGTSAYLLLMWMFARKPMPISFWYRDVFIFAALMFLLPAAAACARSNVLLGLTVVLYPFSLLLNYPFNQAGFNGSITEVSLAAAGSIALFLNCLTGVLAWLFIVIRAGWCRFVTKP